MKSRLNNTKMRHKLVLKSLILFIIIMVSSCLDPIELDVPKILTDGVVIQGSMVRNGGNATVRIYTSLITNETRPSAVIRLKDAFLINSDGQEIELKESGDGQYSVNIQGSTTFNISNGVSFKVKATTVSNDVYESELKVMAETPKISNLKFGAINSSNPDIKPTIDVVIDTKLNSENSGFNIFKWEIFQAYKLTDQLWNSPEGKLCYVTSAVELLNVPLFDARKSSETNLSNFVVSKRPIDYKFSEGYYTVVVQEAIDEDTYQYFLAYNDLIVREGNIFETPAGVIPSNIKCVNNPDKLAFGYFYVSEQDTARMYMPPAEVGSPGRQCPTPPGEMNPCPIRACCDCLSLKGASLNKPYYWN